VTDDNWQVTGQTKIGIKSGLDYLLTIAELFRDLWHRERGTGLSLVLIFFHFIQFLRVPIENEMLDGM
jgi:hypothetical protein